ncbi:MAG: TonB-dependent receptor, partial [Bacteroidia bacterium]|nr:TonB-dependent receptor [Bacteroidia bacterium]
AGQYTQMSMEQLPGIRGIATHYGLNYIPGTWINSIQVSKGMGSVVNGFESVSGQINIELHKPTTHEKIYFNAYGSQGGRYEANLVLAQQPTKRFSHALFLHASTYSLRMDQNKDGYLDNAIGEQVNALYRVLYDTKTGFVLNASLQYVKDKKLGGQTNFEERFQRDSIRTVYGTMVDAERINGTLKLGYVFAGNKFRSIGLQLNANQQTFHNYFGYNVYHGTQKSTYANLIFQDIIGNTNHKYRVGLSNQTDNLNEHLLNQTHYNFNRNEVVSGAFAEYTYSYLATFTAVVGSRIDYHNMFGWQYVPRLHIRYAPLATTVIRASAGKGWRTANLIAENMGSLISNRTWVFKSAVSGASAYGFAPEEAWNFGLNLNHEFKLNYRDGSIGLDYYYTRFTNQVVADRDRSAQQIIFYALNGESYSRSFQVQLDYQPIRRFDVRFAYRWYDVVTQYEQALRSVPMIAKNRWFLNLAYTTKSKWNFDVTSNWTGQKRLPITINNPQDYRLNEFSNSFWLWNAQVTKSFKKYLSLYVGVENLFNFQQPNAILDGGNPFGNFFDAGLIWGPIFGRMYYAGLRIKI